MGRTNGEWSDHYTIGLFVAMDGAEIGDYSYAQVRDCA